MDLFAHYTMAKIICKYCDYLENGVQSSCLCGEHECDIIVFENTKGGK